MTATTRARKLAPMAAPILLLPCRYVAPLLLPAPRDAARQPESTAATGSIPRATHSPGGSSARAPCDHEPPDPAPRAPVIRPRPPPRPREPLVPAGAPEAAHDLIVVPQSPSFRASTHGVMALVRFLQTSQLLAVRAQQDLPNGGLLLELSPDAFAHQLFFEGAAPTGAPVLIEAWLRTSPSPTPTRFGNPPRETCFALEILGCRFPALSEGMKARIHQILYLRPELVRVDHDATRLERQSPAPTRQPIPHCDVLEIDDA